MAIIDDMKTKLRISNTAYDGEITALIAETRADLISVGVLEAKANDDADPLITRAINTYVKANFGLNNPDAERLQRSYDMLKCHLALSQEYTVEVVS